MNRLFQLTSQLPRKFLSKGGTVINIRSLSSSHATSPATASSFSTSKYESAMASHVDAFRKEMSNLSIGRANPAALDGIKIANTSTKPASSIPLRKASQVTVKDAQTLCVTVFDDAFVGNIDKALRSAGYNPVPAPDSKSILFVSIPRLSVEGREKMSKDVSGVAERIKSRIRAVRADARNDIKKSKMPKDDVRECENKVQVVTDKMVKIVTEILASKTTEIK